MKILKIMCNPHPQATDRDFVDKLNSKFKTASNFEVVRSHTPLFTIVHYAGKVRSHTCIIIIIIITGHFTCVPPVSVLFSGAIQRRRFSGEEQRHDSGQHPWALHQQRDSSAQRSLRRFVTLSFWSHICDHLKSEACLIYIWDFYIWEFHFSLTVRAYGVITINNIRM